MPLGVRDFLELAHIPADHVYSYGSDASQFGHLYLPLRRGSCPVAIVLHGGCWRAPYGLLPMSSLCSMLAGEGLAVWNLEYRRLGNGGGWPATFEDAGAGADFLRTLAAPHDLDLSRVVALGHSAGGHLALWLAGRHRLPAASVIATADPLRLCGVISLAGIADLEDAYRTEICGGACGDLLGGSPDGEPERYAQASPARLLPLGAPQWHIVGEEDATVPAEHVQRYAAIAAGRGALRLDLVPHAGHFELVVPSTPACDVVRRAVLALAGLDQDRRGARQEG